MASRGSGQARVRGFSCCVFTLPLMLFLSLLSMPDAVSGENGRAGISLWERDLKSVLKAGDKAFRANLQMLEELSVKDSISLLELHDPEKDLRIYAAHVYEHGRTHIFRLVIFYDLTGHLKQISILDYPSNRGTAALSKRYLKKFVSYHAEDEKDAQDFDIASGASYTSAGIIRAVIESAELVAEELASGVEGISGSY